MADYTEIKYVDVTLGQDIPSAGSVNFPYQTIDYCVSQLTTVNALVYISKGVNLVTELPNMSSVGRTITFIGENANTVIEVQSTNSVGKNNWKGVSNIYSCIIRPADTFAGDTRVIFYTDDNILISFYNVCFTKSLNLQYPTTHYFYTYLNTSAVQRNKYFYNCSFPDDLPPTLNGGGGNYINCAIKYSGVITGFLTNTIMNCLFNDDFFITDETNIGTVDNNFYGVYSGENIWTAILLRKNGLYYSIYDIFYDSINLEYSPLDNPDPNYKFSPSKLFKQTTIGTETFRPIDKFDNFSVILPIIGTNNYININGIKTLNELAVQSFDINTSFMEIINTINCNIINSESADIKISFSKDMGENWFTITDGIVTPLDCIIPKKKYIDFTNDDLIHFNAAKNTIYETGFTPETLISFDFNSINSERLRFAYVLSTDSYSNNPLIQDLIINYDEKGYRQEMKDSECDIEVFDHTVKVKSKIDSPLIETSIII